MMFGRRGNLLRMLSVLAVSAAFLILAFTLVVPKTSSQIASANEYAQACPTDWCAEKSLCGQEIESRTCESSGTEEMVCCKPHEIAVV